VVARALGQIWGAMSDDEKLPYQQTAAAEREQVLAAMEAWKAAGGVVDDPDSSHAKAAAEGALDYPVARIRKICKLDPDVKGLSKEALLMVTKAAELLTAKLGKECVKSAAIQNRRKLLPDDVAQVCSAREQFLFLREDIQDLHKQQVDDAAQTKTTKVKSSSGTTGSSKQVAAAKNTRPLTSFFKAA
jgi:DNA-directed RNA polymerase I subunit RPA43